MTSTKQMIVQAFSKAFNKYFYNELVVGKLAHSEMKSAINKGDEVDITMPGMVRLFDYDGGDLPTAEGATISKHREILSDIAQNYSTKEQYNDLKAQLNIMQAKIDKIYDVIIEGGCK